MIYNNSVVEVSRSAIIHSLKLFKQLIGKNRKLMPVVKSNAYGHGLVEVAKICNKNSAVNFIATVSLEEALILRQNKITKPILVLSYYSLDSKQITQAVIKNISLVVYRQDQIEFISKIAKKSNRKARVHLKVDTGTSRLGLKSKPALKLANKILRKKELILEGLFTHYAAAEEKNQYFTNEQSKDFYNLIQIFESQNIFIPLKHSACSAAMLMNKTALFDGGRLGISLYGLWSLENGNRVRKKINLKPALSWKTKVIQVKELNKGESVGYGRTYKVKNKTKIAVLPVGYWDGYDRKLSNKGEVLIKGKRCKVLGRVCMNLIMVDISKTNAKVGDEAVLIGKQSKQEITADEIAEKIGTINYEVVTRINPLIKRKIVT